MRYGVVIKFLHGEDDHAFFASFNLGLRKGTWHGIVSSTNAIANSGIPFYSSIFLEVNNGLMFVFGWIRVRIQVASNFHVCLPLNLRNRVCTKIDRFTLLIIGFVAGIGGLLMITSLMGDMPLVSNVPDQL